MHDLIWWILIGMLSGWVTGIIVNGGGYGVIMDIVMGISGALVGDLVVSQIGLIDSGGIFHRLIVAVSGGVVLTLLLRFFTRGRIRQI